MAVSEVAYLVVGMAVGAGAAAPALLLASRGRANAEGENLKAEAQEAKARAAAAEGELARERESRAREAQNARGEIDRLESLRTQAETQIRQHAATTAHAQATATAATGQTVGLTAERDAARVERDEAAARGRSLEIDLVAAVARAGHAERSKDEGLAAARQAAADRELALAEGHAAALAGLRAAADALREAHARELAARDLQIADQKAYIANCDAALAKAFDDASAKALNDAMRGFNEQAQARFKEEQERAGERSEQEKREIARLLEPMHKEIAELEELSVKLEASRAKAEGALDERLQRIHQTSETLANALKKPGVRGAWGEQQLKRILDSAGMTEGLHYRLQDHTEEEGDGLRTDVVILLPKGREVVIDSKAPLDHYSAAMNAATEEERARSAELHARSVRGHFRALKSKEYWRRYPGSPDCVVLFIPYEGAYQLACEHDRDLLTDCHAAKIVLANPMTLMGLIHVASYALQEDRMKGDIEKVRDAGVSLCGRLGHVLGLLAKHRRHLGTAVESYNEIVGSVERRLLPSARAMERLGIADAKPTSVPTILQANVRILPVAEADSEDQALLALGEPEDSAD